MLYNIDLQTFFNSIFYIPSCIFFKDTDLKYRFCTKYWEQLNGDDVYGKTDEEIRLDKDNAKKAKEEDLKILATGKGTRYIIKTNINNNLQYLEIIKEPVYDKGEIVGIIGLVNDVTEKTLLYKQLEEVSTKDWLTKTLNRRAGTEGIKKLLQQNSNKIFCLLDIDNFKSFNDIYGHQTGDKVLQEIAKCLKDSIFERDIIMRIGGDEFVILLNDINEDNIHTFINKLFKNIDNINIPNLEEETISVSIGMVRTNENSTFDSLYAKADTNMYKAKKENRNYYIYTGV